MKYLLLLLFIFSQNSHAQKHTKVFFEVSSADNIDSLFLVKGSSPYNAENLVDSTKLTNHKGGFKIALSEPGAYIVRTSLSKGVILLFFFGIPGEKMNVRWLINGPNNSTAIFENSPVNKTYYEEVTGPGILAINKMNAASNSAYSNSSSVDSIKRAIFNSQGKFWADSLRKIYFKHIKLYPKNFSALFMLNLLYNKYSEVEVAAFLKSLPRKLKNHSLARQIAYNKFELTKITKFASFDLYERSGKKFDYKPFEDKIVLVDFWASWCGPCLANIPKIDSLQHKYKDKGFAILGVSIDKDRKAWLKALATEKMSWQNVIEAKAMEGMSVKYFQISDIPRYVILGKGGVILDRDVKITEADDVINRVLNEK